MSRRSEARAADAHYQQNGGTPAVFEIGDKVRSNAGQGVVERVAYSASMEALLYTVAIDTRTKLRLLGRDLTLIRKA